MYGMDLENDGTGMAFGTSDYQSVDDLASADYANTITGGLLGAVAGMAISPAVSYVANETMWAVTNPGEHPPEWQVYKALTYLLMIPRTFVASSVGGSIVGAYMGNRFLDEHEGGDCSAEDADIIL